MKMLIKFTILVFMFSLITSSYGQSNDNKCSIMHNGTFFYGKTKDKMVVIKDNILTENWGYGQFIITCNIVWINDCEYSYLILKVSRPNNKYNVGDWLNVKITDVRENRIYYTASRNSYSWDGYFIKKKDSKKK